MQLTSKCLFSGDESSRKVSIYMYMYNKLAIYRIMRLIIIINYLMKKKKFWLFSLLFVSFQPSKAEDVRSEGKEEEEGSPTKKKRVLPNWMVEMSKTSAPKVTSKTPSKPPGRFYIF